ncbi:hypothetical protein VC279_06275 [Xanthomonas sp. WHRI 10064A]|uniref:hypothetical protein n=1 Tax=unclassified Xanthomonas TaxID=2643310 RepID=UPI002B23B32C|nr:MULTISPECIES: hypothetical protein [unclassified Xanthomonas]MEA9585918.1 hypothetical protein [Xanthomonas sp. WHRI 10064B]MEA9614345.1 hypothetical protein [Xanthomonas sp. WHRI 10064A]
MAVAEVSDKMPTTTHIWIITLVASAVCAALTAWRPWAGVSVAVLPAFWLTGLLLEMNSPDVGPYLSAEQGRSYYIQAYLAVGVFVATLVFGLRLALRRRKTIRASARARKHH